jgi:hypothetical protein
VGKQFAQMEDQIPPSQLPSLPQISLEQLEEMKARAKELAIQQTMAQQQIAQQPPQVVYVRRNLTVAELLLVFLLSCGLVTGVQAAWNFATNVLPRLEIKVK